MTFGVDGRALDEPGQPDDRIADQGRGVGARLDGVATGDAGLERRGIDGQALPPSDLHISAQRRLRCNDAGVARDLDLTAPGRTATIAGQTTSRLLRTQRHTPFSRSREPVLAGERSAGWRRAPGASALAATLGVCALALSSGAAVRGQAPAVKTVPPAAARPAAPKPAAAAAARATAPEPAHTFDSLVKPFVEENCASCHGPRRQKGGLNLAKYDSLEALIADADRWEHVVQKLRDGDMPPAEEEPRPEPAQVAAVAGFVEREIAKADAAAPPDPGRVTARRLNRTEYNNTVRDLLGLDLRPADEFPHDDSGYGFDNIGDVLSTSPLLLEKQLAAAERIARTAVFGVGALKPSLVKLPMLNGRVVESKEIPATYDTSGLTLPNAAHATYRVPHTGEYIVRLITSGRRPQGSMPLRFALWVDGARAADLELDPSLGAGFDPGEQELSGRRVEFRLKLTAGEHWIAGSPLNLYEGLPERFGGPNPSTLVVPKPEFRPRPGMTPEQIEFARKRFEARLNERMVVNTPRVGGIEPGPPLHLRARGRHAAGPRRRLPHADPEVARRSGIPPAGEGRGGRPARRSRLAGRAGNRFVRGGADVGDPGGPRLA
jgi:mono/diheme cytochrome c family protein